MEDLIQKHIFESIQKDKIKFINAQGLDKGSDYDIYCVVDDSIKSTVKIFKDGNNWIEIFIDNWSDMESKIHNFDEICVSFIRNIENFFNNDDSLESAKKLISTNFTLPEMRRSLVYYRIKVLYSKYKGVNTQNEKQYFKGLIMNQLFFLAFDYARVWPTSPKKWFSQLKKMNNDYSKKVLIAQNDDKLFEEICKDEENKFTGLYIVKESRDNQITFLG